MIKLIFERVKSNYAALNPNADRISVEKQPFSISIDQFWREMHPFCQTNASGQPHQHCWSNYDLSASCHSRVINGPKSAGKWEVRGYRETGTTE